MNTPPTPAWFVPDLYPFRRRVVDIDGAAVHYLDEGDGPVLLMLHGNPTWSFLYRRMVAGLKDRFRCIALDYPGFGLSTAPAGYGFTAAEHARTVERFVEILDLTDVTLVVQDWGGPIGMAAATLHPDRYRALVVGNSWAWPRKDDATRRFSGIMGGERSGDWMSRRFNLFVGQLIPRSMQRRKLTKQERAMYSGPFPTVESRTPVQVFPRELVTAQQFLHDVESRLTAVEHLPTLILWANKDLAFRKPDLLRWEQVLPDHRTHMLVGAGHYWQDDAGEEAVLVIRDWFDGVPDPTA